MTTVPLNRGRQTFRVASPLKAMLPAIVTLGITVIIIFIVSEPDDLVIMPYFCLLLLGILGLAAWLITRTRLEVSSDGITYHSIGYKVRSIWPNIAGYGKRLMGTQDVEVLILREPGMEMSAWMRIGYMLYPVGQLAAAAQGRYLTGRANLDDYSVWIPVGLYAENWRDSDLGEWVRRYAPQAFDTPL